MLIQSQMPQQHRTTEHQGRRVRLVLPLDIETHVPTPGFKDSHVAAHVAAGDDARPAHESSADVGEDAPVEIGHDHDVELLWFGHTLHRRIIHNHVVGLQGGEVSRDRIERVAKQSVSELHDVGLVNTSDFVAVIGEGEGEGELGDALAFRARDDLERLHHAADGLVFETRVLAFGVLTDDAEVDVPVAGLVAGNVLDEDDRGIDVEFLPHGDVEGYVAGAADGCVENAF